MLSFLTPQSGSLRSRATGIPIRSRYFATVRRERSNPDSAIARRNFSSLIGCRLSSSSTSCAMRASILRLVMTAPGAVSPPSAPSKLSSVLSPRILPLSAFPSPLTLSDLSDPLESLKKKRRGNVPQGVTTYFPAVAREMTEKSRPVNAAISLIIMGRKAYTSSVAK